MPANNFERQTINVKPKQAKETWNKIIFFRFFLILLAFWFLRYC
tara:strand:+ start:266 stop:397 length:132 start_codon:yes stop_codon:yes gene_type:complete